MTLYKWGKFEIKPNLKTVGEGYYTLAYLRYDEGGRYTWYYTVPPVFSKSKLHNGEILLENQFYSGYRDSRIISSYEYGSKSKTLEAFKKDVTKRFNDAKQYAENGYFYDKDSRYNGDKKYYVLSGMRDLTFSDLGDGCHAGFCPDKLVLDPNNPSNKGSRLDTVTSTNRNAYPNDGESGDYWYVYEGIANQEPSISDKDEDLGGFKAPFKKVFSVDDPDNNETLNVTVKLNSVTIRTINNATKGESYEIDIDKAKFDELELNKTNTIEITVSDSNGASAIRRYTFKKVNTNPVVTITNSNLGEQNKPFSFSFKANDPDGDDITVKVYVDDVQVQDLGKVTPDQSIGVNVGKLDYAKLLNG
ncbi:hypothetical protein HKO22_00500 [Peptoniphilus sp. AGMB00490]|uniref:Uncharacterized protein n=1 Tax=Peptoniphilus faecalis TaxID=2731255 RepID=A0A848RDW9_9FIRM|nr:hypothetical protein [Peptoniphilus faecalis]NMW84225.1 hypothetical protein [Peptoniphilus faecalis]